MDVSEALRLPGVVDVITAADIPGQKVRKLFAYKEELLAQTQVGSQDVHLDLGQAENWTSCPFQVSCVGQMLCAVVADTRVHAKRAAAAVKVSYQDLPDPIFTVEVSKELRASNRART